MVLYLAPFDTNLPTSMAAWMSPDGLDPGLCPGVLSPEFGGLGYQQMLDSYRQEKQSDLTLVSAWRQISNTGMAAGESWSVIGSAAEEREPDLPDKPSMAVLDFEVIGSHPEGSRWVSSHTSRWFRWRHRFRS